jgi:AcrR family transcriptional regulator
MNAASQLFCHGGYEEVSVAQILEHSSLKAPSLYHHYQDKEGLYVAWATQALDKIAEKVRVALRDSTHSLENIVEALIDGPEMDILQVMRDMRALKKPDSREALKQHLDYSVYLPLEGHLMRHFGMDKDQAQAQASLIVHGAMCLHPAYSESSKGLSAGFITRVLGPGPGTGHG